MKDTAINETYPFLTTHIPSSTFRGRLDPQRLESDELFALFLVTLIPVYLLTLNGAIGHGDTVATSSWSFDFLVAGRAET